MKNLFLLLVVVIYPVIFMHRELVPGASSLLQFSSRLDSSGTVRQAQILSRMGTLWSHNFLDNAPSGVSFWNTSSISQSLQFVALWTLTRVFSPILSVNLWILMGWILSGLAAYFLAKKIGASYFGSISAALFCESLPWMREKAMTHMSYVFLGIPLFALILMMKVSENPTLKRVSYLAIFIIGTLFFDLYWFYFTVIIFVVYLISNRSDFCRIVARLSIQQRRKLILMCCGLFSFLGFGFFIAQSLMSQSKAGRSRFTIWDRSFIDTFQGSIIRFIRPNSTHLLFPRAADNVVSFEDTVQYAGVVLLLLASLALLVKFQNNDDFMLGRRGILFVEIIVFVILTLPTSISIGSFSIQTPVSFLRFFTPGIRVFARSGLVAEAFLCVLAGVGVSVIQKFYKRFLIGNIVALSVVFIALLDLNPFSRHFDLDVYTDFKAVRNALSEEPSHVLLILQPDLDPTYFPTYVTEGRLAVNPENSEWGGGSWEYASRGDELFAVWLLQHGVTHVLVPLNATGNPEYSRKWGDYPTVQLSFSSPWFTKVASSSGILKGDLFRINPSTKPNDNFHLHKFSLKWAGVRDLFYRRGFVPNPYSYYFEDGANISWVVPTETPRVALESDAPLGTKFQMTFELVPAYGGEAQPQIVRVDSWGSSQIVELSPGITASVSVLVEAGEEVSFQRFLPCTVPAFHEPGNPDMRAICYAITSLQVKQVVP